MIGQFGPRAGKGEDVGERHDGTDGDPTLALDLLHRARRRALGRPALLPIQQLDDAEQVAAGRVDQVARAADRRPGRDDIVEHEDALAGQRRANERSALYTPSARNPRSASPYLAVRFRLFAVQVSVSVSERRRTDCTQSRSTCLSSDTARRP